MFVFLFDANQAKRNIEMSNHATSISEGVNLRTCIFKGQLISKCPFGFIVWTKYQRNYSWISALSFFCSFLGASWKLFWASCRLPCLWYYILSHQEAQRASMKPPGSYKKTQGRNPEIISLVFLSKRWNQKDILKLTDL